MAEDAPPDTGPLTDGPVAEVEQVTGEVPLGESADDGPAGAEVPVGMRAWAVPVLVALLFGVGWPAAGIVLLVVGVLTAMHSNIVDASYNLAIGVVIAVPSWFAARAAWTELRH
jgi:hypothetical protein